MADTISQPFRMPESDSLPPAGTPLEGMIRFISTFELAIIRQFRERWGEEYKGRVQAHWSECVRRFKAGAPAEGPADELLLCLAYDCVLGPYLGVPEPHKLVFWDWLLAGVRQPGLGRSGGENPGEPGLANG
ncbi:MAG: hypothetical protein L0Y72_23560 [Gemmataceae bacterium]|nr:hypothetical protein [Gemmataceae bacterium]MCI0742022.1 hypothetical protein [Gemmataceae bacterium]